MLREIAEIAEIAGRLDTGPDRGMLRWMRSGFLTAVLMVGLLVPCPAVCALAEDVGVAGVASAAGDAQMPACHQAPDAPNAPDAPGAADPAPVDGQGCCRDRADAPVLQSSSPLDLLPGAPTGQILAVPDGDTDVIVSTRSSRLVLGARALSPSRTLHGCNPPLLI